MPRRKPGLFLRNVPNVMVPLSQWPMSHCDVERPCDKFSDRWTQRARSHTVPGAMEQLMQFAADYWPHLLGVFFVIIMAANFRTWLVDRKS